MTTMFDCGSSHVRRMGRGDGNGAGLQVRVLAREEDGLASRVVLFYIAVHRVSKRSDGHLFHNILQHYGGELRGATAIRCAFLLVGLPIGAAYPSSRSTAIWDSLLLSAASIVYLMVFLINSAGEIPTEYTARPALRTMSRSGLGLWTLTGTWSSPSASQG